MCGLWCVWSVVCVVCGVCAFNTYRLPVRFGKPLRILKTTPPTCQTTHSDGGSGDDNDSGVMVSQGSRHAPSPVQSQPAVVPTQPPVVMPSFPAPSSGSQGQMAVSGSFLHLKSGSHFTNILRARDRFTEIRKIHH